MPLLEGSERVTDELRVHSIVMVADMVDHPTVNGLLVNLIVPLSFYLTKYNAKIDISEYQPCSPA